MFLWRVLGVWWRHAWNMHSFGGKVSLGIVTECTTRAFRAPCKNLQLHLTRQPSQDQRNEQTSTASCSTSIEWCRSGVVVRQQKRGEAGAVSSKASMHGAKDSPKSGCRDKGTIPVSFLRNGGQAEDNGAAGENLLLLETFRGCLLLHSQAPH